MSSKGTLPVAGHAGAHASLLLRPVKIDKHGPAFVKRDVVAFVYRLVLTEDFFHKKAKIMNEDAEKAIATTEDMTKRFSETLDRFLKMENSIATRSKAVSSAVREAADRMASSLQRIEKTANFDRLERFVVLLERAAAAMQTLSELEDDGKLNRLSEALR